ncbi:hypothetical protein BC834DRAFT_645425 [Gloeopeniophorella convolvens]|nr:hypothetical protein BC834DRAFT_645425 [Gloeopeniophorella convolvens]
MFEELAVLAFSFQLPPLAWSYPLSAMSSTILLFSYALLVRVVSAKGGSDGSNGSSNGRTCFHSDDDDDDDGDDDGKGSATHCTSMSPTSSPTPNPFSGPGIGAVRSASGLSHGAIAGIVVGTLAALALLLLGIFLFRRRRRRAAVAGREQSDIDPDPHSPYPPEMRMANDSGVTPVLGRSGVAPRKPALPALSSDISTHKSSQSLPSTATSAPPPVSHSVIPGSPPPASWRPTISEEYAPSFPAIRSDVATYHGHAEYERTRQEAIGSDDSPPQYTF